MTRTIRTLLATGLLMLAGAVIAPASQVLAVSSGVWTWVGPTNQRVQGVALSNDGSVMYAASTHNSANSTTAVISKSTDGGTTWATAGNIPQGSWYSVATDADGSHAIAVGQISSVNKVFATSNGGLGWTDVTPGTGTLTTSSSSIVDVSDDGATLAVATSAGALISTDGGANWNATPITADVLGVRLGDAGGTLMVTAVSGTAFYSWHPPFVGASMSTIGGTNTGFDVSADGQKIIVVSGTTPPQSHISTNGGINWTTTTHSDIGSNLWARAAISEDGSRFAVTVYGGGITESTDYGTTWIKDNSAYFATLARMQIDFSADGSILLAGLEGSGAGLALRTPVPAPSVTNLSVTESSTSGGRETYIYGDYFIDVLSVTIGGAAASYNLQNSQLIVATTPAGTVGGADLVVTTAHGTVTFEDAVDYYAPSAPTVSATSDDEGTFLGDDAITFTGTGLTEVTEVLIGGEAARINSASNTELEVSTPPNRVGLMDITITNPSGVLVLDDAWTSTWEARSLSPEWDSVDADGDPLITYENYTYDDYPIVNAIVDDGDGGLYVGGSFEGAGGVDEADYIVHWDGESATSLGPDDEMIYSNFDEWFYQTGVVTVAVGGDGRVWAGGGFYLDGDDANIAVFDPTTEEWQAPSEVPDGMVLAVDELANGDIIVGGNFVDLGGDDAADLIATLDPETLTWSALGSDGEGGSAFAGSGSFDYGDPAVTAIDHLSTGEVIAGGNFALDGSTNTYGDLAAVWDGTTWSPLVRALEGETALDVTVGLVDGEESIVISTCIDDEGAGRVLVADLEGHTETIATAGSCVADVEIVEGAVLAAGWFRSELSTGTMVPTGAMVRTGGTWHDLDLPEEYPAAVHVNSDYEITAGGYWWDIGVVRSTPINRLLGLVPNEVTVTSATVPVAGSAGTVTVTGTGFDDDCEVTIDGRPVANLEIVSATQLTFTAPANSIGAEVTVYGWLNFKSATIAAEPATTTTTPATTTTTVPAGDALTEDQIAAFPIADDLIPADASLTPGSPVTVTASGFAPGEEVEVLIASTPQLLGTATVAGDGTVSTTVTLPTDLTGQHTLIVYSPTTGRGVRLPITITTGILPATGDTTPIALVFMMIAAGAWLTLASRRRQLMN